MKRQIVGAWVLGRVGCPPTSADSAPDPKPQRYGNTSVPLWPSSSVVHTTIVCHVPSVPYWPNDPKGFVYETHVALAELTLGTHLLLIYGGLADVTAVLTLADSCALVASAASLGDTHRAYDKQALAAAWCLSIELACYRRPLLPTALPLLFFFPDDITYLAGCWPMASRSDSQPLKACDVTSRSRVPSTWPGAWPAPGPEMGKPLRMWHCWGSTRPAASGKRQAGRLGI